MILRQRHVRRPGDDKNCLASPCWMAELSAITGIAATRSRSSQILSWPRLLAFGAHAISGAQTVEQLMPSGSMILKKHQRPGIDTPQHAITPPRILLSPPRIVKLPRAYDASSPTAADEMPPSMAKTSPVSIIAKCRYRHQSVSSAENAVVSKRRRAIFSSIR